MSTPALVDGIAAAATATSPDGGRYAVVVHRPPVGDAHVAPVMREHLRLVATAYYAGSGVGVRERHHAAAMLADDMVGSSRSVTVVAVTRDTLDGYLRLTRRYRLGGVLR